MIFEEGMIIAEEEDNSGKQLIVRDILDDLFPNVLHRYIYVFIYVLCMYYHH